MPLGINGTYFRYHPRDVQHDAPGVLTYARAAAEEGFDANVTVDHYPLIEYDAADTKAMAIRICCYTPGRCVLHSQHDGGFELLTVDRYGGLTTAGTAVTRYRMRVFSGTLPTAGGRHIFGCIVKPAKGEYSCFSRRDHL